MAWKKGESGNPNGRPRRTIVTDCIVRELLSAAEDGDGDKARSLAKSLVSRALNGDMRAAEICLDRVEGKPDQTIHVRRTARELADDELNNIAAGSSNRAAEPQESPEVTSSVH